jgi:transcriptional regulator with XRE-family HTH domain
MIEQLKKIRIVGDFIKNKRESKGLSQKALGLMFDPAVTTQFISNMERGVTPVPPVHIPVLSKILEFSELELMTLLEQEYALKLNKRLGKQPGFASTSIHTNNHINSIAKASLSPSVDPLAQQPLEISHQYYDFMKILYEAVRKSDVKTRQAFASACESILKLPKSGAGALHLLTTSDALPNKSGQHS